MKIKSVRIKNFRSFNNEGINIDLPEINSPISIIGYNNAGKTNFINAVLYCLGKKSFSNNTFCENDFHLKNTDEEILIEVDLEPPLQTSDAYNKILEMSKARLRISCKNGVFETSHKFCDTNGTDSFTVKAVARSKQKTYTEAERDILNETLKTGIEPVWKWKDKIPLVYIDTYNPLSQLKLNYNTLLGKVFSQIKKDFHDKDNLMEKAPDVNDEHIGKPREAVYNEVLDYLEKYIISSKKLDELIDSISEILSLQLELPKEDFSIRFGLPNVESFFNSFTFYLSDRTNIPQFPVSYMGNGFLSLFIVALFRAITKAQDGDNIFIIEEPETYLHELFQEYFYKVLQELSLNNQVICTTHSKKFVDIFNPKSILRFKRDELSHSIIVKNDLNVYPPKYIGDLELKNPQDFAKYMRTLEPNLGNIVFSNKILIVEGPHDLLAYQLALSKALNLPLNNIAVVAAWGKDPIPTLIQLCKKYEIDYFVCHDWDLTDEDIDCSIDFASSLVYSGLDVKEKAQYTKNYKILKEADFKNVHQNKVKLESVLGIPDNEKGTVSVYKKLFDLPFNDIISSYPGLFDEAMFKFFEIPKELTSVTKEKATVPVENVAE